jgi:hypothetical protein
MEKPRERSLAARIVRGVARNLRPFGYQHTKPTFICREYPHLSGFFHFHKYTFGPAFRVHFGIRVLNSAFPAAHLNGPSLDGGHYADDEQSVRERIQLLSELLIRDGLSWVEHWLSGERLISDPESPLSEDDKLLLSAALEKGPDPANLQISRGVLRLDRLTMRSSQPVTGAKIYT